MLKLILLIVAILLVGVFALYSKKMLLIFLRRQERVRGLVFSLIGSRAKEFNLKMERASLTKQKSLMARTNFYFKNMIRNLDMEKDDVTPAGLIIFITSVASIGSLLFLYFSKELVLTLPMFITLFYLTMVVLNFIGLTQYEKKEADIMDVEDLIAMDIKDGVYNAIIRYHDSFNPRVKPYFTEFIDNIRNRGYSFKKAMTLLNHRLGHNFNSFTQKAIQYEEKADDDMVEIFSNIIEINRTRRILREENAKKFNQLRLALIVNFIMIGLFGVFSMVSDQFIRHFFLDLLFGKILIIVDVIIIAVSLAYIASIKSKFI